MIIKREWSMPNKDTFDIKPIKKLRQLSLGDKLNSFVLCAINQT